MRRCASGLHTACCNHHLPSVLITGSLAPCSPAQASSSEHIVQVISGPAGGVQESSISTTSPRSGPGAARGRGPPPSLLCGGVMRQVGPPPPPPHREGRHQKKSIKVLQQPSPAQPSPAQAAPLEIWAGGWAAQQVVVTGDCSGRDGELSTVSYSGDQEQSQPRSLTQSIISPQDFLRIRQQSTRDSCGNT